MTERRKRARELQWWLIGWLGRFLIHGICCTMRIHIVDVEPVRKIIEAGKYIFAFWHSRIVVISYLYRDCKTAILVSSSDDGEIIARILQRQGHTTIRGSTSRHGVRALARLVKVIKAEGCPGAVVPDGPRGPRFKVQPGIITLAKKTARPIIPITYSCRRMKVFSSWDRFILPCPFSECSVVYGTPIMVPVDADGETQEGCRRRLEKELNRITTTADSHYDHLIL